MLWQTSLNLTIYYTVDNIKDAEKLSSWKTIFLCNVW